MKDQSTTSILNQHGTGRGSDPTGLDRSAEKALTARQKLKAIKTPDSKIPKPLKPFAGQPQVGKRGKMVGMKTAEALVLECAGLLPEKRAAFGDSIRGALGMETEADRARRAAMIGAAIPIIGGVAGPVGGATEGGWEGGVGALGGQILGTGVGGLVGGIGGSALARLTRGRVHPLSGGGWGALAGSYGGGILGAGEGAAWGVENL